MYRSRKKSTRIIRILDDVGAYRLLKLRSHLNVKSHQSTLNALEKRAQRYGSRLKTATELDEELVAGASEKAGTAHKDEENLFIDNDWSEQERLEILQLLKDKPHLLQVIGVAQGRKADGVVRLD